MVNDSLVASEVPNIQQDCRGIWVCINIKGGSSLYILAPSTGRLHPYRQPASDEDFIHHLGSAIEKVPPSANILLLGNFNLSDISWEEDKFSPGGHLPAVSKAMIDIVLSRHRVQVVKEVTENRRSSQLLPDISDLHCIQATEAHCPQVYHDSWITWTTANLLSNFQHSFRKECSCELQLALVIQDLASVGSSCQTDAIMLDFSKAFDKVPHKCLLYKLGCYGITGQTLAWFNNFLCCRHQSVILDGTILQKANVISAMPQGTVLGPLFFLVYINDLPNNLKSTVHLFADDCILYRLQKGYKYP